MATDDPREGGRTGATVAPIAASPELARALELLAERVKAEEAGASPRTPGVIRREAGQRLWEVVDKLRPAEGAGPTEGRTGGGDDGGDGRDVEPLQVRPQRGKLDPRLSSIASLSTDALALFRDIEDTTRERAYSENTTRQDAPLRSELDRVQLSPYLHGLRTLREVEDFDQIELDVFIRFQGDVKALIQQGVTVRSAVPGLCTARVTKGMLPKLEAMPEVIYVELSRPMDMSLDGSRALIGAEALQTATCSASDPGVVLCPLTASGTEDCSVTGQGVVIGVIDGGFDFRHPDFWNLDGDVLRVREIWDMTASADPAYPAPTGYGYGRLYTGAQLSADVYSGAPGSVVPYMAPEQSHGTHVAGIAAGAGVVDPARRGVAPAAELICVDMVNSGVLALGDMTELMDAVAFIFQRAAGAPCVINISLNDNLGPHDGRSYAEQFIDAQLTAPGRAVVVAAGNANDQEKHTAGKLSGALQVRFTVPALPAGVGESIELWYDGGDRFDVVIEAPNGDSILLPGGFAVTQAGFGTLNSLVGDHRLNDPRNGDNFVSFILLPGGGDPIPPGTWTLHLRPANGDPAQVVDGRFHAWIDRNTAIGGSHGVVWVDPVDEALTVQVPGTARRVLTVGNTTKTTAEKIHDSSGRGPTRDGRVKPDLVAPGTAINACRAMDWQIPYGGTAPSVPSDPGAYYVQKTGTSMAAPHVTGAVALLFEGLDPNLDAAGIASALQSALKVPGPSETPEEVGHGHLRLQDVLCQVPAGPDLWARTHSTDTGVEPYAGPEPWRSPDIWVRNDEDDGALHLNPLFGQVNYVYGRVRNRGPAAASGVRVRLYWADPSTNIPTSAWRSDGIRVDGVLGNEQVLPLVGPGEVVSLTPFGWTPPAPGSSIAGDNHFCLLLVIDHPDDPAELGSGGWAKVRERNNIALKNVHVIEITEGESAASASFAVVGGDGADLLQVDLSELPSGAVASLSLPVAALDLASALPASVTSSLGARLSSPQKVAQLLKGVTLDGDALSGLRGVSKLRFAGSQAVMRLGQRKASLRALSLDTGERALARLSLAGLDVEEGDRFSLHVEHLVDGVSLGGLSAEVRVGAGAGPLRDPTREP
ncbi:MAG: S8 family serine peptidase [Alphaproteobacteria bacterium]|nr:S8 family serine peptidase [Alphaproteobacteria bacterium]